MQKELWPQLADPIEVGVDRQNQQIPELPWSLVSLLLEAPANQT
jgi:hypothetical protein